MKDHTILYYTANLISEDFANNVREQIIQSCNGTKIISISHKPIDFGENICVDGFPVSPYSVYRQILMGAKVAQTRYLICCEDDTLYVSEHFSYIPPDDTFCYNVNRWSVTPEFYFYRERRLMSMCVANRELMIETLEKRFEKYPEQQVPHFGEPGRFEGRLGLPPVKIESFKTEISTITFNHRKNMGGKRKTFVTDKIIAELPYWGRAEDLWKRIYG
jgi:hypothetical protein